MSQKHKTTSSQHNVRVALAGLTAAAATTAMTAAMIYVRKHDVHIRPSVSGPVVVKTLSERQNPTGYPVRVMQMGGVYQSATYLDVDHMNEPVFKYYKVFDDLFAASAPAHRQVPSILLLGGGAFSYPKHLLYTHPTATIDVVEIDPQVVEIARKYFYLAPLEFDFAPKKDNDGNDLAVTQSGGIPRLSIKNGDGRTYLEHTQPGRYDAIINDTFTGKYAAPNLVTREAAQVAKRALSQGGVYVANIVSAQDGADVSFLRDEVATLSKVFAHVYIELADDETFGGEDNYIVLASDEKLNVDDIPYDKDFLGKVLRDPRGLKRLVAHK